MIWNTALQISNHLLCVCLLPKMHCVTRLWPLIMFKHSIPLSLNLVSQNICGVKIALALHNFFASRSHGTVTLKLGLNCILRTFVHGSPLDKGRNNQPVKSVFATTAAPARQQRICSGGGPFSSTTFRIKQFATTAATVQYKATSHAFVRGSHRNKDYVLQYILKCSQIAAGTSFRPQQAEIRTPAQVQAV